MPDDIVDPRPLAGESQRLPAEGGLLSVEWFLTVVALAVAYFVTGWLALFVVITGFVFFGPLHLGSDQYPMAFLPLPCLVWMAFHLDPGGVALAASLLSGIAAYATSHGSGPFVRDVTNESLLLLQAFTGLATLTGLTLAAAVTGHKHAETSLKRLNVELKQRVRDRTAELVEANRQLASEIIKLQQAEETARQLALTDELTGLHNRRGFLFLADQEWRIARRSHQLSMSVGIEELPDAADISLEALVARADQAMYAQKRENRQRQGSRDNASSSWRSG